MQQDNAIRVVYERDIDLLLLEEMHCNPHFRGWLWQQCYDGDGRPATFRSARHSVTQPGLGESDLILVQEGADGRLRALLLENKVDALAQPDQAQRYRKRGNIGVEAGEWDRFRTGLVAPEAYLSASDNAHRYDVQLSYEAIQRWFKEHSEGAANPRRMAYKARIVANAIEQQRNAYPPAADEAVSRFWREYWRYVTSEFPQLRMNKPGKKSAKADWPEFTNTNRSPGHKLRHKLRIGAVDLQFSGLGARIEALRAANQERLPAGVHLLQTGSSASFRIEVPAIDTARPFAAQEEQVKAGLEAALRLLDLYPHLQT